MALIDDMSPESIALALVVTVAAGFMRGFAGVGSGMLMAPFFAILFGPIQTVAIIITMEIIVTAQLLPSTYRHIDWRVVGPMGGAAALFMPLGTVLLTSLDPTLLSRAIGGVVLVFALILLVGWRYHGPKKMPYSLGVGGLSGVLMAATSLGNPPVMVYLLSSQDRAETNRANFTGYFAVTLTTLLVWMGIKGLIAEAALVRALVLLLPFMGAAWAGARLFRKSSEALYRRVALCVLVGAGLYGLFRV